MRELFPSIYRLLPRKAVRMANRWKDFSPSTVAIMYKSSLALLCLLIFIRLTFMVSHATSIQTFDEYILHWVESLRNPILNAVMLDVTALGGLTITVILGVLSLAVFFIIRDPAAAIHLTIATSGAYGIAVWAKSLVLRGRPTIIPQLIHVSGFSYPSGHSVTSATLYMTMAILACRHIRSFKARAGLFFLVALMMTLISFSRIYLGVHYPSDTLSGAFIGMAWALFMGALFSKTHFA